MTVERLCVGCGKQSQWTLAGEEYCEPCLYEELRPLAVLADGEVFTIATIPHRRKRSPASTLGDQVRRMKFNRARQRAATRLIHLHLGQYDAILDEELAEEGIARVRHRRSVDAIARQNGSKIMGLEQTWR